MRDVTLFLPYISYCNEIWGNTYSTNVNCLYILQKKAIRLMFCADRLAHTNEIFKDLSILKVLLYINDICNISNFVKFVLFADDTNIFCSSNSLHDLQNLLNRELAKLFVWFSVNKLSLNLGKTNYMLFRNRPPENGLELRINNVIIPRVACTKFLGILIDESLNWKPHIQSIFVIYPTSLNLCCLQTTPTYFVQVIACMTCRIY